MRVALLTNFVPPYRLSLFQSLSERVDHLSILTSTEMEPGRPWRSATGTLDVVVQKTFSWAQSQRHDGFRDRVAVHVPLDTGRQLARIAPDVIVSGELGARTVSAMRFGRKHGIPVIVWATLSERSESRRGTLRRMLRRRLLTAADHVLVNGASGQRYVMSFGVPLERITRVPYTTSMEPFLHLPIERPPHLALRLLCVGNLIPRKAPDALLEGARTVASAAQPIELTYVGDGPLRGVLERRAGEATAGLSVHFAGAAAYGSLPGYYAAADVLAFPTLSDEWGLVVNEALAAGVPVLGSPASQAVDETIVDGENGWLLQACDAAGIARGLERVLATSPAERLQMREAARTRAASLEPSAAAERILQALTSATAARR